jgi:hypothetical protein
MSHDTTSQHSGSEDDGDLHLEIEPVGLDQSAVDALIGDRSGHPSVRDWLDGTHHRLLAFDLIDPELKYKQPQAAEIFRATYYDYTNNRSVFVDGSLAERERIAVTESSQQPLPSPEEFAVAVDVVMRDPELGPAIRDGSLQPYESMPPLVEVELPEGRVDRTLTVGLLPTTRRGGCHEIVGVNLVTQVVERYDDAAPITARATKGACGAPVSAGQQTTGKGVPGQVWITVVRGNTVLWRFLAVRPSASSGNWGSGVELRHVSYRGRSVLYQAHVPILNVLYDANACGPYRDWQYQEGMLQATGTTVAPGFILCPTPAQTILDTGSDLGNFLGVAIYVDGPEVVLVSEMQAGWYRYISEWRLHANGAISPRFGFDATSSSCVCIRHHHHVYWRFDFDIETPGNNVVQEFNDPPLIPGTNWHTKQYEIMRLRSQQHHRRWRVENAGSGRGYTIIPGGNDGSAAGDPYARGDLWFLRYHPGEIDDYPISGTEIQIDKYRNGEPLVNQDVVIWYGAHFTHDASGPPADHVVGPTLRPHRWGRGVKP